MTFRVVGVRLVGVGLVILGAWIWSARLDYFPEQVLQQQLAERLVEISPNQVNDLSDVCGRVAESDNWVLFVMKANLISDTKFRTFFETAEERVGLWIEYDPGLLRLGLGLGPESNDSNTEIPIRWVRRDETATVMIGVSRNETRLVTNAIDKIKAWPGDLAAVWRCNAVQVGNESRELSEGNTCAGCNVQLRYATGSDVVELTAVLDSLSNVQAFNTKRLTGSVITLAGALLVIFGPNMSLRAVAQRIRRRVQRGDS